MADYKNVFSTTALNTGGRDGKSALTDGSLEINAKDHNPEELFALGYSACYNGAMDVVKADEGVEGDSLVKTTVHFYSRPENDFKLSADFEVGIEGLDLDRVQEIAEKTHEVCPYSKAVKGNIEINTKAVEYDSLKE